MSDCYAGAGASPQFTSSTQMPVSAFRQILWLPLCSHPDISPHNAEFRPHWEPLAGDLLSAADATNSPCNAAADYAAYLYFHPYIRRFLFDRKESDDSAERPALTVWRLADATKHRYIDALMSIGQWGAADNVYTSRFRIERCLLYQFRVGVVMLEVELAWEACLHAGSRSPGQPELSLAEVMDALDFLRRTHPGYFPLNDPDNKLAPVLHLAGGRYPLAVELRAEGDALMPLQVAHKALADRKQALLATVRERQPGGYATPLGEPWRTLLGPVADWTVQLDDERMPYMAYVAVSAPHRISPGDWVRLAGADYRGDSAKAPYGKRFLQNFDREHCYDRYFCPEQAWTSTRFLNTGYAFTMVGASGGEFNFFTSDGLLHFRRIYSCIGLLAHFNKAALLLFSNRLSEAIELRKVDDGKGYRDRVVEIQGDLLEFTHRYWFDGASNQLQAGELQAFWFKHLRLQALYDGVMAEARAAHDFVIVAEERSQTRAIERLTKGGLGIAAFGLLLAAMGAGFPFDKPLSAYTEKIGESPCWLWQPDCYSTGPRTTVLTLTLAVAVGLITYLIYLFRPSAKNRNQEKASCPTTTSTSKPSTSATSSTTPKT